MLRKTIPKMNKAISMSTMSQIGSIGSKQNYTLDLSDQITQLKKEGRNLFGALYSTHDRHTVYKAVEASDYSQSLKRKSTYDYVSNFTKVVLPKIEKFVEQRLLEKFKDNLSIEERVLVEDSYRMRRHLADTQSKIVPVEEKSTTEDKHMIQMPQLSTIIENPRGEGFRFHDTSSIGKYVVFPDSKRKEFFPFGCYGDYMNNEFKHTQKFGIMIREEGLKFTRAFSQITTHEERLKKIDFDAILNRRFNFAEELNKIEVFSLFFQEFCYSILKVLEITNNYEYKYIFTNPDIMDSLASVLTKSLEKQHLDIFLIIPSTRYFIIEDIIKNIHEKLGNSFKHTSEEIKDKELKITEKDFYPIYNFFDIIEKFNSFDYEMDYKYVFEFANTIGVKLTHPSYANKKNEDFETISINLDKLKDRNLYQWRPEEMKQSLPRFKGFNSGVLFTGEGNGKSMTLAYLHAWAKESGWFVIPVGDVDKYLKTEFPIERHLSGIYFQPELALHLLTEIKIVNYKLLQNTPVDLREYGKFNIAGTRDGDPEPNPVIWDNRSRTYTDSWKEWNAIPEEEIIAEDHPDHHLRLREVLPKPKTLLDIVNAGIENNRLATCAFAELTYALSKNEKTKTMILIDNYTELFKPTIYDSYKYANYKNYQGKIPPHDIALPRMFMTFDGHFYKQGVKVCSISLKKYNNHKFKPELINFPKGYSYEIGNLKLDDTRKAVNYLAYTGLTNAYGDLDIQDLWQNSQGNWKQLFHDLRVGTRGVPNQMFWLQRNATKKIIAEAKKF